MLGVTIHSISLVAAVMVPYVPENTVVAGVPAKIIKNI